MQIPDATRASRKACIFLLGISDAYFAKLKSDGVFQSLERGVYHLPTVVRDWVTFKISGTSPESESLADEKRRLVVAQRMQIEQRLQIENAQQLPRADVIAAFSQAMHLISSQLDGLAGRVSAEVAGIDDPAEVRALLFSETRRIRDGAAAQLQDFISSQTGSRNSQASAGEDD